MNKVRVWESVVVRKVSRVEKRCRGVFFFFFQAEDGIRDLVRSRGLGDVYKRQGIYTYIYRYIYIYIGTSVSYTHLTLPTILRV